jgi:hypothetical protein
MRVSLDTKLFNKQLNNIINYSTGFLDGVQNGKKVFLNNLGDGTIQALGQYIDVNAKMNPQALHHVYEWYQSGGPGSRLFDLDYKVSNLGLSVKSSFRQSSSISDESSEPFYDKARVMELGIPMTIRPRTAKVLSFEIDGEQVFTSNPVRIDNPGGANVEGSYERVFDEFFRNYFTQAFLRASGVFDYIEKPVAYKKDFSRGSKEGRSRGLSTGYTWIANAKIGTN